MTADSRRFTVRTLDLGMLRGGFVASHLVEIHQHGGVRRALVDAGTSKTTAALEDGLARLGVLPDSIEWVFLTHVHLDHAGGAGELLARVLPRATLVVHENGLRHMTHPEKLEKAARSVYGDAIFERDYGALVPVSEERVVVGREGPWSGFGDLEILDTPGHARHHLAYWFPLDGVLFTGDTYGLCYPELQAAGSRSFVYPTTSPAAFEPDKLKASVRRLAALGAKEAYLAHFGCLENPAQYGEDLCRRIDRLTALALALRDERGEAFDESFEKSLTQAITEELGAELERGGWDRTTGLEALRFDRVLNAQGLVTWLARGVSI